jgi:hypothetical protein
MPTIFQLARGSETRKPGAGNDNVHAHHVSIVGTAMPTTTRP